MKSECLCFGTRYNTANMMKYINENGMCPSCDEEEFNEEDEYSDTDDE